MLETEIVSCRADIENTLTVREWPPFYYKDYMLPLLGRFLPENRNCPPPQGHYPKMHLWKTHGLPHHSHTQHAVLQSSEQSQTHLSRLPRWERYCHKMSQIFWAHFLYASFSWKELTSVCLPVCCENQTRICFFVCWLDLAEEGHWGVCWWGESSLAGCYWPSHCRIWMPNLARLVEPRCPLKIHLGRIHWERLTHQLNTKVLPL